MTTAYEGLRHWAPIVSSSDELAARCWEAIHAISESILNRDYGEKRTHLYEEALLFGYLARAEKDGRWLELALERLTGAIEAAAPATYCGLFGGLCGLGWTVDHLSQMLTDGDLPSGIDETEAQAEQNGDDDVNSDIDTLLLRELQRGRWTGPYDLVSGLVGFGVYFLQRLPGEKAGLGVELIVYHLNKAAERNGKHIAWHTPPELLPAWQAARHPDGYYNLGVTHGIPGVLDFLSQVVASGVEREKAMRLLEGGMEWLLAQERPPDAATRFGCTVGDPNDSRLAWCYGDLGIMAVLQNIARRCGREDWRGFAEKIAESCLVRPDDKINAKDAPLCHGYTGIAHIFNCTYQQNGDRRFAETALKHINRALEMRGARGGVAGFYTVRTDPKSPPISEADPAFLDGAIGIALALLAAVTPIEPVWDRMLLLSGRYDGNS